MNPITAKRISEQIGKQKQRIKNNHNKNSNITINLVGIRSTSAKQQQKLNNGQLRNCKRQDSSWRSRGFVAMIITSTRGGLLMVHDFDDHTLTLLAVARCSTDEVERPRVIKPEHWVACVGEEVRVRGIAPLVFRVCHLHHWVLLVLEACTHTCKMDLKS